MRQYGLNDRFQVLAGMYPEYAVGRITSQEKGLYQLVTNQGEKLAEVAGKFRYHAVLRRQFLSTMPTIAWMLWRLSK